MPFTAMILHLQPSVMKRNAYYTIDLHLLVICSIRSALVLDQPWQHLQLNGFL